ncbi:MULTISPECIES: hypothetical protein [unclassified Janthinobacterium]|uniref:hypothetical protein n=1 Tax=unclassified Janthinobacterium TaxID=2610881 RepID=UPI000477FD3D|nr:MULTISPECIES: hypothetical protein [unclassified Janthinobacterium]MEC5160850.1 hypothetical protein [Janthinobacterium sp. CG_S6]
MKSSRHFRYVAALIALFSMLFMQLAVASYACPNLRTGQNNGALAQSSSSGMRNMSACTGMDMQQPSLCHAHSQTGNQSLDKPELPQVQPFVAVELMQALIFLDTAYRPHSAQSPAPLLQRATAPPLSIRNCCFRI